MKVLNGKYVTDTEYLKQTLCQNANRIAGNIITPACESNKRERKVVVYYNEVERDVLYLCEECTKVVKRDARRRGYRVRTTKL